MFRLKEVSRIFKAKSGVKTALDGVSLTLPEKGMVFVIGRSGSGKSTFLNVTSGLDKASSGDVFYGDRDYKKLKGRDFDYLHHREFGFVFQDYCLIEEINVEDNVALGALESKKKIRGSINALLKEVFLEGYNKKLVKQLSGGEKQRVAIARALIKKPKVVFCDEPTGNLDHLSSLRVFSALKKYSREALVVIVTHDREAACVFGDRIIELENGKVKSDKTLDEGKVEEGKYMISSSLYTSEAELSHINSMLEQGKIDGIGSRFSKFVDTVDSKIEDPVSTKKERRRVHCQKTLFRIFNARPAKTILFSFFTGIVLAILCTCFSLNRFSSTDYLRQHPEIYDSGMVMRRLPDEAKETSYSYSMFPITKDCLSLLDERLPDSYFLFYRVPASFPNSKNQNSVEGFGTTIKNYYSFFVTQTEGALVTNREFLAEKLGQKELKILEDPDPVPGGVYLTDYLCDSINYHKGTHLNYSDFLHRPVKEGYSLSSNAFYVNGVIKTGYRERYRDLISLFQESSGNVDRSMLTDHADEFEFIRDYLSVCYSFDPDFIEKINADHNAQNSICVNNVQITDSKGERPLAVPYSVHLSENPSLEDDEMLISSDGFLRANSKNGTYEEINARLASLGKLRVTSDMPAHVKGGGYLLNDNFRVQITEKKSETTLQVSPNVYMRLKDQYLFPAKVYIHDDCDRSVLTDIISSSDFILSTFFYETLCRVDNTVLKVAPLFKLLSSVCLIAASLIVAYYAYSSISSERYNIGVLKSLGIQNAQLGVGLISKTSIFAGFSVSFFGLAYWIMSLFTDDVLKVILSTRLFNFGISISIEVGFKPLLYLFCSAVFFAGVLTLTSLLLLKLVHIKPVRIIRNKD